MRYDIQKLTTAGSSTFSGTFKISFDTTSRLLGSVETTGQLSHSITALDLKYELESYRMLVSLMS